MQKILINFSRQFFLNVKNVLVYRQQMHQTAVSFLTVQRSCYLL